ncbi:MAG: ACT domain-containing protein [Verrucomicrobiae bacterium]|nr:ACT domain-containing protein [Verrucomicrobiae bacterium]
MQRTLVMTIIGPDRPGLVEQVAALVAAHGGNWLESRMAHLGGQFAGILRVAVPPEQQAALENALRQLHQAGLHVVAQAGPTPPAASPAGRLLRLELVGHDRPGIVRDISRVLAAHNVNVEELETGCESAPMSGEILFRAQAQISVPPACDLAALRAALEKIAADLIVDLHLREI